MLNSPRTSRYLNGLSDLEAYGCDPMSVRELMDEFEQFPVFDVDAEGLVDI